MEDEEVTAVDIRSEVSFFVPGMPKPGGSKKAFFSPKAKRIVVVDDCAKNKDWRASVALVASQHFTEPWSGPLEVSFVFHMPRPRGHFRTGKNADQVRDSAPRWPETRPDVLKLSRSTEDAMSGICWRDDSQIVLEHIQKVYGSTVGAQIRIRKYGVSDRNVEMPKPLETNRPQVGFLFAEGLLTKVPARVLYVGLWTEHRDAWLERNR